MEIFARALAHLLDARSRRFESKIETKFTSFDKGQHNIHEYNLDTISRPFPIHTFVILLFCTDNQQSRLLKEATGPFAQHSSLKLTKSSNEEIWFRNVCEILLLAFGLPLKACTKID